MVLSLYHTFSHISKQKRDSASVQLKHDTLVICICTIQAWHLNVDRLSGVNSSSVFILVVCVHTEARAGKDTGRKQQEILNFVGLEKLSIEYQERLFTGV